MFQSVPANLLSALNLLSVANFDFDVRLNVLMAFIILMMLASIAIVVVVMMQKGTNDNVGVIAGASDTYYGKHKAKGREGLLKRITLMLFIFIVVCAIVFSLVHFLYTE